MERSNVSRRRLVIKLGVVILLAGVAVYFIGPFGAPEGEPKELEWGDVDDEETEILATMWIDNPNIGVSADADITYQMAMNGYFLAEGEHEGIDIPRGNHTATMSVALQNDQFSDWWASHIQRGGTSDLELFIGASLSAGPFSASPGLLIERDFEMDFEQAIGAPLEEMEGEYSLDLDQVDMLDSQIIDPSVEITGTDVSLEADQVYTNVQMQIGVENSNRFPIPTPGLTGEITLNGLEMAEWDFHDVELLSGERDAIIPRGGHETLTYEATVRNDDMADWFISHIKNDERTIAEVTGQLAFSINGHQFTIPAETGLLAADDNAVACSFFVETDMLTTETADAVEIGSETVRVDPNEVDAETEHELEECEFTRWNIGGGTSSGLVDFDLINHLVENDDPQRCEYFPNLPVCN